jgi:hypothetical protein
MFELRFRGVIRLPKGKEKGDGGDGDKEEDQLSPLQSAAGTP